MTRRGLLKALAVLPGLGWLRPAEADRSWFSHYGPTETFFSPEFRELGIWQTREALLAPAELQVLPFCEDAYDVVITLSQSGSYVRHERFGQGPGQILEDCAFMPGEGSSEGAPR